MLGGISAAFVLLTASVVAKGMPDQNTEALTLRGNVESVQVKEIDHSSALIDIKLKMELLNAGQRPIIHLKREPLFPGGALARLPQDFETGNLLADDAGWPSNDISAEWTNLRSNLDKPRPPAAETRVLMPGDSWPLETSVRLVVPIDPSKSSSSLRKKESLVTIQQLSPVWLSVVCEIWPWNVEPLNAERSQLKFGHKLQERWKDLGLLWLNEIYSEPILIDLKTVPLKRMP
jgi:hypothetical protein